MRKREVRDSRFDSGDEVEVEAVGEMLLEGDDVDELGGAVARVVVRSEARSSKSVEVILSILCSEMSQGDRRARMSTHWLQ